MSRGRRSLRFYLLGLLLLLCGAGAGASETALLTTYHGDATGWNNAQKIVVSTAGTIYIVYQVSLTPAQDRDRFAYGRSEDGLVWEVRELEGRWPAIATAGDVIYITFIERGEEDRLWLYRLAAGHWEGQIILSSPPRSLFYPAIAVGDGRVHLAWEAHRGERSSIEYAVLAPFGVEPQVEVIAESPSGLYFPSLALGPDGLHLAFEEAVDASHHRIVHTRRGSEGWAGEPVSQEELDVRYPALDYDPERDIYGLVFVSYSSSGNGIYYRALAGGNWGEAQLLSRGLEPGYWAFPTVEDGLVVWGRTVAAGCSIGPLYWSYPADGTRGSPQVLEGDFAAFPHLFRKNNTWHLVWTDRDPSSPIWRVIKYRELRPP